MRIKRTIGYVLIILVAAGEIAMFCQMPLLIVGAFILMIIALGLFIALLAWLFKN